MTITTVAQLVRAARGSRSQKEFAKELGVKQSSVSRYESGRANPPVKVIEYCMRVAHSADHEGAPTADQLAAKVRTELADSDLREIRFLLARLIDKLGSNPGRHV